MDISQRIPACQGNSIFCIFALRNLFLLVLNLPIIGLWVRLLTLPYRLLYPTILVFCGIGVYSLNNALFDIYFDE